ncbi:MAG: hypothetical protein OHK93_004269 [Ramalina farinacea]|uniref:Calcineurin-like phosphoesterase domain-containing protein n=1 Tax=Ramalina farinacea TaxID=258253 RepID=A0AA43QIQ6_9LECA|nr:hypothetical protein [Ramalina farinacea]
MITRYALWALPLELVGLVLAMQPSAMPPVPAPLRELPWAQLNFLHTTDTHGWHAGHLLEPSYSADWGDYISFSTRLKEKADSEGRDILLVDTGDRIEGNGLYDASHPKGKYDLEIFSEQHIDVICSGNHELYKRTSVDYEYNTTVPNFKDNYIASNLDFRDLETNEVKPLAQRYKKFTTKNQGIRILAFGFIFDFTNAADNIQVVEVEDAIKQDWFQEAIRDRDVDLFLVAGHVALHSPEYQAIFKAIRKQQWDVPIQFFGGHLHTRDYAKYDNKAWGLASGRYLETIGFMSINGLNTRAKKTFNSLTSSLFPRSNSRLSTSASSPTFARRYIDNNLFSFHHHTSLNDSTFPTPHGLNVTAKISSVRKKLRLDDAYGCAPHTFWTNRAPVPSQDSVFTLLQDQILPDMVTDPARKHVPRLVLSNTGAIRFDIFEGPFTKDSMYTVSPFTSGFRYIRDVKYGIAKRLLQILNQEVPQLCTTSNTSAATKTPNSLSSPPPPFIRRRQRRRPPLTPGYTTHDAGGTDGDDTIHSPIEFYNVPNCIQSRVGFATELNPATNAAEDAANSVRSKSSSTDEPPTVDLVYNAFLEKYVLLALQFLGASFSEEDTGAYMKGETMTSVIGEWVKREWPCEEDEVVGLRG